MLFPELETVPPRYNIEKKNCIHMPTSKLVSALKKVMTKREIEMQALSDKMDQERDAAIKALSDKMDKDRDEALQALSDKIDLECQECVDGFNVLVEKTPVVESAPIGAELVPSVAKPTITHPKCVKRQSIKLIEPQYEESKRPPRGSGSETGYSGSEYGYSYNERDRLYKCNMCDYTHAKMNSAQQHCVKHFPGKHSCTDCGDIFHIKTAYQNHFLVKCLCGMDIRKGSISGHTKHCPTLSTLQKTDWKIVDHKIVKKS